MDQIPEPEKGGDVRDLWKPVTKAVKTINALGNLEINLKGQQNKLILTDAKATLELNASDIGGGGGGSYYVFAGTASGEPAYFLISSDGVAYANPPKGYTLANPP